MTKTNIIAAARIMLSLAIAGPAQAWPGPSASVECAWEGEFGDCKALAAALIRKHAPAHRHSRKLEHTVMPFASSHQPDRDEDPLASMHFD